MKVVALCNKLTRSRTLLKDALEDPEAATEKPVAVVSNMTTGKTAEVRIFTKLNWHTKFHVYSYFVS